jgi:hypothetical protein
MARETYLSTTPVCSGKKPALQCVLVPKGQYFAYTYDDRGAYIRESWLTKIACVIDTASHFVNELSLTRHARIITVDMQTKPAADSSLVVYSFTYDTIQAVRVPVGMTLSVNGKVSFVINATYRIEKKSIVFDTRQICYPASATQTLSCLMMTYGTYTTDEIPVAAMKPAKPKEYTEHMEKAALLCRKALDCIRNGTLDAAIPLLDKAVSSYPETPQAAEARQLLRGLPGNHVAR